MSDDQFCYLDWSRVPFSVLQLQPDERIVALLRLVETHRGPTCPKHFVTGVTPLSPAEHVAAVLFFLMSGVGMLTLPLMLLLGLAFGSWSMVATVFTTTCILALHPIEVGAEWAHRSRLTHLLFRYFSYRTVWRGAVDVRKRAESAGPSLAYGVPHGVFPFGNLLACAAINLLGIPFVGSAADVVGRVPILRWIHYLGVVSAAKHSVLEQIRRGTHVGLVPDGIAGIFYTVREREVVPIQSRMGAAKLALAHGISLQPSYLFGNSSVFSVWYDEAGRLQRLSRHLRVSLMPFWGRWGTPVPRRAPLTFALGDELRVARAAADLPDAEARAQVARVHGEVLARIAAVYECYRGAYGWAERELAFV